MNVEKDLKYPHSKPDKENYQTSPFVNLLSISKLCPK